MVKRQSILAFLLGFSAIIAQTVILRAFQVVFYGNELSYAIILASWLLWVGLGSLLAARIFHKIQCSDTMLAMSFMVFALVIPGIIFGIRYIKPILDIPAGQLIGMTPIILSGIILTAPVAFFVGVLFVMLCSGEQSGRVYVAEAAGSAVGGMIFSLILLQFFNTTTIVCQAAVAVACTLVILYRAHRILRIVLFFMFLFIWGFSQVNDAFDLDLRSQQKQWPAGELVEVADSPYQNIAVVKQEGQISFYQNGILSFTSPDRMSAETNVDFALLAHPDPRDILLIGNGMGGEITQILKFPKTKVDFVEIDPALVALGERYLPDVSKNILNNKRVWVIMADARQFVRRIHKKYDTIIVNVGDPYTAGINRYYTEEFFQELAGVLKPGGAVSLRVSSSENYLNDENRLFLRSIDRTLRTVFPDVRSIPGDTHTFLASDMPGRIDLKSGVFIRRLKAAGVEGKFVSEYTLPFLMDPFRIKQVEKTLVDKPGMINRDLFPHVYLFNILLWSTHFDLGLQWVVRRLTVPFWIVLLIVAGVMACLGYLLRRKRTSSGVIGLAVATAGFSEIVFEVVVILAFQSLYGVVYHKIGMILAAFMFGLVVGSRLAVRLCERPVEHIRKIFALVQAGIIVYPLVLPVLFVMFRDLPLAQRWTGLFSVLFAFLPFVAGFLGGLQFPLATLLRTSFRREEEMRSAGTLYALDVFGAAVGALITGVFLVPMFGIVAVCVLCAVVNGVVLIFLKGTQALDTRH